MNATILPTSVVVRSKDIPFSSVDDELLAVDAQAGYCYSLNETAGRIWDLIASPTSVSKVGSQLSREYVVDEATCTREIITLLQELCNAGLVELGQETSRKDP